MRAIAFAAISAVVIAACSHSPAEPDAPARSNEAPAMATLHWTAPGTWSNEAAPATGVKRAAYKTAPAGDAKVGADVEVFFFGTGTPGDPDKNFKQLYTQFDGDVGATAKHDAFQAGGFPVETVEVSGTYKIDLGPHAGPSHRAAAQMVRKDYRLVAAVVKTPDRGNWFFKMVGPDASVEAARSSFRALLDSVK